MRVDTLVLVVVLVVAESVWVKFIVEWKPGGLTGVTVVVSVIVGKAVLTK